MEAGKRNITEIFNRNRVLEIPFFQRSYVWKEENWERFLDDMITVSDENKDYFLGSIILKQKETPSNSTIGDIRGIVDGQQRLTTLCLFFKELCSAQDRSEEFFDLFKNRNKDLIIKHNHYDQEIFEAILNDSLSEGILKRNRDSKILACQIFFSSKHSLLDEININNLLNKIYFVGIDLGKDEDEQQIFDTINSLGVSLTTAELLKNELFKREDEALYNNTWKLTFEGDERTYWSQQVTAGRSRRENIDLLLQAYLTIESEAKERYMRTEGLFKNLKGFLKENTDQDVSYSKTVFVNNLVEKARIYQDNVSPGLTRQVINKDSAIERINLIIFGLNTTTIIPYLVFILDAVKDTIERDKMISLIESYLIRRMVCRETTKNYNNLFASFIRNNVKSLKALTERLNEGNQTDFYPTDNAFCQGIQDSNLTNQQSKLFLYLLEISIRDSARESTSIFGLDNYSLEHILPKKWRNYWKDLSSADDSDFRDDLLLKLGNLTIVTASLNSSVRDASWITKRNGKNGKGGLFEHSKGIKIFDREEFLHSDTWNEEVIKNRNEFLSEKALTIWPEINFFN